MKAAACSIACSAEKSRRCWCTSAATRSWGRRTWPSCASWSINWKRRSAAVAELLMRMLAGATLGLALVLLLRRPARRVFGAGPAFTLWLLPLVLALAPLLPEEVAPRAMIVVPGLTITPQLAASAARQSAVIDWTQWSLAVWLVGAAGALLRLAASYLRLLRGLRHAPDTWARMLADVASDIDSCRVRMHDAGPAVLWALPRSLILLPADFAGRFDNAASREVVLRHELTHAHRGDAWWSLAMEAASALLWSIRSRGSRARAFGWTRNW